MDRPQRLAAQSLELERRPASPGGGGGARAQSALRLLADHRPLEVFVRRERSGPETAPRTARGGEETQQTIRGGRERFSPAHRQRGGHSGGRQTRLSR